MGIAKKIYEILLRGREIFSRKTFKVIFFSLLVTLFFFGTLNIFAQATDGELYAEGSTEEDQDEGIIISPAWEETKMFHNYANDLPAEQIGEDNQNTRLGGEILNSAFTVLTILAPELTGVSSDEAQASLPYDLRRGLVGMVEDAGVNAYAMYPVIDVPEHLAQQWVPGYKEGSVSTYAGETGYEALTATGIDKIWGSVLNVSYVFFIIVMIIGGFMIMFRHKLGGQAMVTLGSVLPKVIIALIIATFSFAIAGIIIDLGGILISLIAGIFIDSGLDKTHEFYNIGTFSGLMNGSTGGVWGGEGTLFYSLKKLYWNKEFFVAGSQSEGIFKIIKTIWSIAKWSIAALPSFNAKVATGVIGLLGYVAIIGVILFGAIKVLITLYKAYFSLLISVILGPLQITLGAIPGNDSMQKNWFLSILRNVLVFPVVFFLINLPNVLEAITEGEFGLPQRLTGTKSATAEDINMGLIFIVFMRIFVLYYAAQAPKFLESFLPPTTSKSSLEGMAGAKATMARIPLVGKFFKEKR